MTHASKITWSIQSANCATSVKTTLTSPVQLLIGEDETIPRIIQIPFSLKHNPPPESPEEHLKFENS